MDLVGFSSAGFKDDGWWRWFSLPVTFYLALKTSLIRDTIKGILQMKGGATDDDIYEERH